MTWNLKRLLMAEMDNEADGGESPTTFNSALDSLNSGYEPFDGFPMNEVKAELQTMIETHGGETNVETHLTSEDWKLRAKGK